MEPDERLRRARLQTPTNLAFIPLDAVDDPLVPIASSDKVFVEPYWQIASNWEGERYLSYIASHPDYVGIYLRSEVWKRLQTAAAQLDDSLRLVIRSGHRPVVVQNQMLEDAVMDFQQNNPGVSYDQALDHARQYVSDPSLRLPPHVCGAAVDVAIVDRDGNLIDFGSEMNETSESSHLFASSLTEQQRHNRDMLLSAMLSAGFASFSTEWWHYSYGDQVWAWFYHKEACLYGQIDA